MRLKFMVVNDTSPFHITLEKPREFKYKSGGNQYKRRKVVHPVNTLVHRNHRFGPDVYKMYTKGQRNLIPDMMEQVSFALKLGASVQLVQTEMSKTGDRPISKALHNLKYHVRERVTLQQAYDKLKSDSGGTVFAEHYLKPDTDGNAVLKVLFWSSAEMRDAFSDFPEVMFMDDTFQINIEGYTLSGFMGQNAHGKGTIFGLGFKDRPDKESVRFMLERLIRSNPEAIAKLKVVVVDKDFKEIDVLRELLPFVIILLCLFHVKKCLRDKLTVSRYGITSSQKDLILSHMEAESRPTQSTTWRPGKSYF